MVFGWWYCFRRWWRRGLNCSTIRRWQKRVPRNLVCYCCFVLSCHPTITVSKRSMEITLRNLLCKPFSQISSSKVILQEGRKGSKMFLFQVVLYCSFVCAFLSRFSPWFIVSLLECLPFLALFVCQGESRMPAFRLGASTSEYVSRNYVAWDYLGFFPSLLRFLKRSVSQPHGVVVMHF